MDDDNDPTTDAELVAFWGTVPDAPVVLHRLGLKGMITILPMQLNLGSQLQQQSWHAWNVNEEGSLYSIDKIEDTLNLGLNYVVEVGLNSTIGSKFTIRITPHVAR